MTGAEFRLARHLLGLPAEWLAQRWDVNLRTIQRWDMATSPVPAAIAAMLEGLMAEAFDVVEDLATALPPDGRLIMPRTDEDVHGGDYPASWYRAIGARLMDERPDVTFDYSGEGYALVK